MKNTIIIILSILLLAVTGYMLYDSFNNDMSKAEVQAQFNDLKSDYENMQKDLENSITALGTTNEQMASDKKKIDEIMQKNSITEAELKEAKSLMKKMNQYLIDDYKLRLKNLQEEKQLLTNTNTNLGELKEKNEKEILDLTKKISLLNIDKEQLESKNILIKKESDRKNLLLEYASKLRLSNFAFRSFKVRGNGKEVETDKASKIDRIKLSLDVDENKLARSGEKEIFLVVYKPDGSVAKFSNKESGSFSGNGKPMTYSDKMKINYVQEQSQQLELVWDSEDFSRGSYIIEVYEMDPMTKTSEKIGKVTKVLE